ncbi:MAG: FkbM family methyltransferase [Nitrolancea sp.]
MRLSEDVSFKIAVGGRATDPISQAARTGDNWFLDDYRVLFGLMKQGDVVLDVGAHIGTFGLAAAALGCQVVCIEAAPENVALLRASAAVNGFEHLHVVSGAATNHDGAVRFLPNGPWGTIANPTVLSSPSAIYARELNPIDVPAVTIDRLLTEYALDHVDFVKLDVEGGEVAAIEGMSKLLSGHHAPVILYESNAFALGFAGHTPDKLLKSLGELGYSSYMLDSDRLIRIREGEFRPECVANFVAVKGDVARIGRHEVRAQRSTSELIQAIVSKSQSDWPHERLYLAGALAHADHSLLSSPAVRTALSVLLHDPLEGVRQAALRSSLIIAESSADADQLK